MKVHESSWKFMISKFHECSCFLKISWLSETNCCHLTGRSVVYLSTPCVEKKSMTKLKWPNSPPQQRIVETRTSEASWIYSTRITPLFAAQSPWSGKISWFRNFVKSFSWKILKVDESWWKFLKVLESSWKFMKVHDSKVSWMFMFLWFLDWMKRTTATSATAF